MPIPGKKHRFSNFISDLRSPSKLGGSFIVQTGFPASLVDLFIKNRYRLRKSSAKKKVHHRGIGSPVIAPPPVNLKNGGFGGCDHEVIDKFSFIAAVLKSLVVVVLALSINSLVFGITLSAFVLLLLEIVIKLLEVNRDLWLKPFCPSKKALNNDSKRLVKPDIGVHCDTVSGTEIEAQGADSGRNEDTNRRSRSRRIKSNIINKWQALKKKIKGKGKRRELDHEEEQSSETSSDHLSGDVHQDCIEKQLGVKINEDSETPRSRRGTNSGCLMLILMVLVGLVGGRIWGLVLTLVWCLILQIVCVHKRRNVD